MDGWTTEAPSGLTFGRLVFGWMVTQLHPLLTVLNQIGVDADIIIMRKLETVMTFAQLPATETSRRSLPLRIPSTANTTRKGGKWCCTKGQLEIP